MNGMSGSSWRFYKFVYVNLSVGRGNKFHEVMDFISFEAIDDDDVYGEENEADICSEKTIMILLMIPKCLALSTKT